MSTTISQFLLPDFDHEMANTRKVLERVPDDRPDFTPHGRSMTLARLAGHLASLPRLGIAALTLDEFDIAPPDSPPMAGEPMTSREALLEEFDARVSLLRSHLAAADDTTLMRKWTLCRGGHVLLSMPRVAVLRTLFLNHTIHHRAQLGVYLRLNDVAVPALYGPTADEM